MDRNPCIMTVKEMKEILNNYSDNDKVYILSLHYKNYSAAILNVQNVDKGIREEILYDFGI